MPAQQVLPGLVPHGLGQVGGPHDVGEQERLPRRGRRPVAGRGLHGLRGGGRVPDRAQPIELRASRLQLQLGVILVALRSERRRQHHPIPGHLEGRAHLLPVPDGRAELLGRPLLVPFRQEHPAPGVVLGGVQRRRPERLGQPGELLRRLRGRGHVPGGNGDLHLGREHAGPGPPVPGLLGQSRVDRTERRVDLSFGQPDQGQGRLRRPAQRMGLPQRVLGAFQVAQAIPDLPQRVEPVGQGRRLVVTGQFLGGLLELLHGHLQAALEREDLRPVDAAHAGEPVDGLPLAPPMRGFRPLASPPVVGGVAACGDHRAVGHPGGDGAELPVHRGDGRLLHQPETLLRPPQGDQERSVPQQAEGLEVGVAVAGTDLDGPSRHLEGAVDLSGHLRPVALRQGQVAVGEALGLPFEETLPPAGPGRCDGALLLERVFPADVERQRGGPAAVAPGQVGLERPLFRLDGQVGVGAEPCRQSQRLQVPGIEIRFPVGPGQQVERLLPPMLR